MAISNTTKVKFYTGTKAKYVEATHSEGIYFATDQPLIHANGVWTGVSKFELSSDSKLKITTGSKLSSGSYSDVVLSVDLSRRLPTSAQISNWNTAYNFVNDISGVDNDKIINKWNEIVSFLAEIKDDSTLSGILAGKANSNVTISAGTGLTGGGDLTANRTLSLAEFGTAGTYYKVTTDAYGRVSTGVASLAISDVTNLQSSLDAKVPTSRKISTTAPLNGGGALSGDLTLSLNYDIEEFKVINGNLILNIIPQSKIKNLATTLATFLTKSNIKAGDGINVTQDTGNDVTIKTALYGGTTGSALEIVQSGTDATTKGLRVKVDDTTIKIDSTSLALAIKSISSFVVNNLTSTSTTTALSAAQGKELDGKITSLKVDVNANSLAITNINSNISSLTTSVSALETQLTWVVVS